MNQAGVYMVYVSRKTSIGTSCLSNGSSLLLLRSVHSKQSVSAILDSLLESKFDFLSLFALARCILM